MWEAVHVFNGHEHYLGMYKTEEEAAKAYDRAALARQGGNAELNVSLDFNESMCFCQAMFIGCHFKGAKVLVLACIITIHAIKVSMHSMHGFQYNRCLLGINGSKS